VFVLIFLRNQPETPPCAAAESEKTEYSNAFKSLFTNSEYIILFISGGLMIGNFGAFSTVLDQILSPFGYTSSDSSIMGTVFMLVGVVGSIGAGKIIDMYKIYRTIWIIIQFVCLIGMLGLMLGLYYFKLNYLLTFILISILGISLTSVTPISLDFACEVSFPVGEAMSSGFIMSLGQIAPVTEILLIDYVKRENHGVGNALKSFYILATASIISTFMAVLIKGIF